MENDPVESTALLAAFKDKKFYKATQTDDGLIMWFEGGIGLLIFNYEGKTCIAQTGERLN